MYVSSATELRDALRQAESGQVIELTPGEYHGPFQIDKPVTLRGQQRKTVLWRKAGPVLYIRAAGVKLEKMLIERTVSSGPLIVHDAGKQPTGKEAMELDSDALINLGELIPGSALRLPLRLEVSARTEIAVTGVYGAHVTPTVLETPGMHTVTLGLDANAVLRGEVLLGEMLLRTNSSTRYLWVSGVVLDAPPPEKYLALVCKKNVLHPSPGGLSLDNIQLAALGLGSIPAGQHAIVGRDASVLYLYLPGDPPSPVSVNGRPIASRTRKLLAEGDSIQIGDVTFAVQVPEALPIEIETPVVYFPDFDNQFPEPGKLMMHTLKNGWRGQVIATVPWLTVSPEGFFRLPPARAHTWSIALNGEALALPDGQYDIPGALLVNGANHVQGVDVRINIQRPQVALHTTLIDAGSVELGWAQDRTLTIPIANLGRGDWVGRVVSNVPWLEVMTPMPLSGGPWSEALVQARFTPDWSSLSVGEYEVPGALWVIILNDDEMPDPAHPSQPITLKIKVDPPRGHLSVGATLVDFPQVERNAPLPDTTITLHNNGAAAWIGTARAIHGWAGISPEEIALKPGESIEVQISLKDIPADQALDETLLIDEITFASSEVSPINGVEGTDGTENVNTSAQVIRVPVQMTVVELPPYLVARPVNFPPFVRGDTPPDGVLSIYNMGPTHWEGRVTANVPWLVTPDREFNAEPGITVGIPISLATNVLDILKPGVNFWENALTISGGRGSVMTLVQVDLRETPMQIILETPTLNFGQVHDNTLDIQPETVRLLNAGAGLWTGEVALKVPWLSLETAERTFSLEIPKGSVAEFKVRLNDEVLRIPPGVITEESAIQISGQGQILSVRALFAINESAPWLALAPKSLVLKNADPYHLAISNEGGRRWSLQALAVPWLEVWPAEFALNPGAAETVSVRYKFDPDADESGAALADPRAVVIVGPGGEYEVAVEVAPTVIKKVRAEKEKAERKAHAEADAEQKRKSQSVPVPKPDGSGGSGDSGAPEAIPPSTSPESKPISEP